MIKKRNIIVFVLLIFSLVSCNLTRKFTQKKEDKKYEDNRQNMGHLSGEDFLKKVETIQPNFQTAYIKKMSVDLKTKDKNVSFQATCKIKRNSAIHFSIRPFIGIELFRVELTPKNIVVVDKINGIYYKENYTIFKEIFGVDMDYQQVEAVLSNRINFENSDYVLVKDSAEYLYFQDGNKENAVLNKGIIFDKKGKFLNMLTVNLVNELVVMIDYSDFQLSDNVLFPHKTQFVAMADKTYNLDFSIEKVVFNRPLRLRKTNLSRYKKGDIKKLLSAQE